MKNPKRYIASMDIHKPDKLVKNINIDRLDCVKLSVSWRLIVFSFSLRFQFYYLSTFFSLSDLSVPCSWRGSKILQPTGKMSVTGHTIYSLILFDLIKLASFSLCVSFPLFINHPLIAIYNFMTVQDFHNVSVIVKFTATVQW